MDDEEIKDAISEALRDRRISHTDYTTFLASEAKKKDAVSAKEIEDREYAATEARLRQKFAKLGNQTMSFEKMLADSAGDTGFGDDGIRVKATSDQYSNDRHVLKHAKWGEAIHPLRNGTVSPAPVESLSEFENAKLGAFFKYKAARAGFGSLSDHERSVLAESFEKDTFIGWRGDELVRTKNVKTLLDDSTSGGENLVPEYFDQRIVSFPLLHSELLPFVDVVDVPRGSSVETASVGNPTLTWNTSEGSAQNLFTTTGLVEQITATIHPVAVYIQIGRDFMQDSLPNIGSQITMNVSQRIANELDKVIASGDGTTQPQGIDVASGTVDVTPQNPTTGAVDINDLLDLMFGVSKQYRTPSNNPRFVMTDARYKSHRALATGVTGDERLLHGSSCLICAQPQTCPGKHCARGVLAVAVERWEGSGGRCG